MTTTNGTLMFCDADSSFSMTMTCTGPNCSKIVGNSNLTCTQTDSDSWQCTNGVKCASALSFTSQFLIVETNTTVLQTQNISINGTSFTFQQDGAGNAALSNGTSTTSSSESSTAVGSSMTDMSTPLTTTTNAVSTVPLSSTAPSVNATTTLQPSSSKTSNAPSSQSYSNLLILAMLALSLFVTQTQADALWTGAKIGTTVEGFFEAFDTGFTAGSLLGQVKSAIAGEFTDVVIKTCGALVSEGVDGLVRLPLAFGQCEEAMVGAEMSAIGGSLGLALRTYAGLGGVLTTALTAADEAAVMAADASIFPEVFIANSALCGLLLAAIKHMALDPASENLCSAVENAAANYKPTPAPTSTTSTKSTSTSSSTSQSTSTTSSAPAPATSGLLPQGFSQSICIDCVLNKYIYALFQLSKQTCNAPVKAASAYDLSAYFCDPDIAPQYAQFCNTLCASPCTAFDIPTIINDMGSDYIADPVANNDQFSALCDNACPPSSGKNYQCGQLPTCRSCVGMEMCTPGCIPLF